MLSKRGERLPPFRRSMSAPRNCIHSFDGREPIDILVGQEVKRRRLEIGLSLETVASALRVPPDWLTSYETGDERILPAHICMLADLFGVRPGVFFEGL